MSPLMLYVRAMGEDGENIACLLVLLMHLELCESLGLIQPSQYKLTHEGERLAEQCVNFMKFLEDQQ